MNLKVLLYELIRQARPQPCASSDLVQANHRFELIGYGEQTGHYWRLGRIDDPEAFYIEDFGNFRYTGKLKIDAITNVEAWNAIWDNVYYNNKGEKIILSISHKDGKFDFRTYNKHSNENGESILKRVQEL